MNTGTLCEGFRGLSSLCGPAAPARSVTASRHERGAAATKLFLTVTRESRVIVATVRASPVESRLATTRPAGPATRPSCARRTARLFVAWNASMQR